VTHFEETFFYYYIHKTFPYCGINIWKQQPLVHERCVK
jgi:hypothetical protein